VLLVDVLTGQEKARLMGHTGQIMSLAFSPDGTSLATGSQDRSIRLWDRASGKVRRILTPNGGWVTAVRFAGDGATLVSGDFDAVVRVWDAANGQEQAILRGHMGPITRLAVTPDGKTLTSNSEDSLKIWDFPVKAGPRELQFPRPSPGSNPESRNFLAYSADRQALLVGEHAGILHRHDLVSGQRQILWQKPATPGSEPMPAALQPAVHYSANGAKAALGIRRFDQEKLVYQGVKLWDISSGREEVLAAYKEPLAFSPDGAILALRKGKFDIALWDVAGNRELPPLNVEKKSVEGEANLPNPDYVSFINVAFSHDRNLVAIHDSDRTCTYEVATGKLLASTDKYRGRASQLAFDPSGQRLAGSDAFGGACWIWDLRDEQRSIKVETQIGGISGLAFTPDGKRLVVYGGDLTKPGELRIVDPVTGQEVLTLSGHPKTINQAVFSPDGQQLAAIDASGLVLIWDASPPLEKTLGHPGQ
jgi:WD40 repeat protein